MTYTIELIMAGFVCATRVWPGDLASAREQARRLVDAAQAQRAEVRDEDGALRWRYPK